MKIRQGFVSNSSTTSFCIYGTCFEEKPFNEKFIKNLYTNHPEIIEQFINDNKDKTWLSTSIEILKNMKNYTQEEWDNFEDDDCIADLFSEGINGLEYHPYYDAGAYYVGRSWSTVGDDETGKQFKTSIEKTLTDVFGEVPCSTHAEAWRDG